MKTIFGSFIVVLCLCGCDEGYSFVDDDDTDTDTETETATDSDTDSDTDTDSDSDTDTDEDGGPDGGEEEDCLGGEGWYDPITGLCWEGDPDPLTHTWDVAREICDTLDLNGHTDWRMPTISELRSIIRGCPASETGGECPVTDDCLDPFCYDPVDVMNYCNTCDYLEGPSPEGCYLPSDMPLGNTSGQCPVYWSISAIPLEVYWWEPKIVATYQGQVGTQAETVMFHVRCVRG